MLYCGISGFHAKTLMFLGIVDLYRPIASSTDRFNRSLWNLYPQSHKASFPLRSDASRSLRDGRAPPSEVICYCILTVLLIDVQGGFCSLPRRRKLRRALVISDQSAPTSIQSISIRQKKTVLQCAVCPRWEKVPRIKRHKF